MSEYTDWVAEHVFEYGRGWCDTGEVRFRRCDWCHRALTSTNGGPCPKRPLPKYTLRDLMVELGKRGHYTQVFYEYRGNWGFLVWVDHRLISSAEDPLEMLSNYTKHTLEKEMSMKDPLVREYDHTPMIEVWSDEKPEVVRSKLRNIPGIAAFGDHEFKTRRCVICRIDPRYDMKEVQDAITDALAEPSTVEIEPTAKYITTAKQGSVSGG